MRLIRHGDHGDEVRDVQGRLDALGMSTAPDLPGDFGDPTREAVRAFQQTRSLTTDGVVGPDTWRALVEAGFDLGDRILYLTRPMLRGDDVHELQQRLNHLGFDSGQVDGIFGPDTQAAVADFQLNAGLDVDGKAGSDTIAALARLRRSHQATPAFDVRERHGLGEHRRRTSLANVRVLIDPAHGIDDPGAISADGTPEHEITWAIANRVHGRLAALGAHPMLARGPRTSPTPSERAALANRERAEVILSIHTNSLDSAEARGVSAAYFGSRASVSEFGRTLANLAVQRIADQTGTPNCRAHPSTASLLRESRAVAVQVEVGFLSHPEEGRRLADPVHQGHLAACLVDALSTYLLD